MKIHPGREYRDRKGRKVIILREMRTDDAHRFLGVTVEESGLECRAPFAGRAWIETPCDTACNSRPAWSRALRRARVD